MRSSLRRAVVYALACSALALLAAAPASAASAEVKIVKRQLAVGPAGNLTIKLSCAAADLACFGTVSLTARGKKQPLASATFIIVGGRTKALNLHISRKARARVKKLHVLHARTTVRARNSAGVSHTTDTAVTLKPT